MILPLLGAVIGSAYGRKVGRQLGVAVQQEIARQVIARELAQMPTTLMPTMPAETWAAADTGGSGPLIPVQLDDFDDGLAEWK
jgi:hypothetical protein